MPGALVGKQKLAELPPELVDFHSQTKQESGAPALKHLQDRHRDALRFMAAGYTLEQVSAITGFSRSWLAEIRESPLGQEYMLQLRVKRDEDVFKARRILEQNAHAMAERLAEIATDPDEEASVALKAIDSAFDRIGIGRVSKSETTVTENKHTTIEHIKTLAAELGRSQYAPPLDAVFEEVTPDGD